MRLCHRDYLPVRIYSHVPQAEKGVLSTAIPGAIGVPIW